jgi:signal transduction histidine kinase
LNGTGGKIRLWPRSLMGQVILAVALALLLVQGLSAALIYREQEARREADLIHSAAFRLIAASRGFPQNNLSGSHNAGHPSSGPDFGAPFPNGPAAAGPAPVPPPGNPEFAPPRFRGPAPYRSATSPLTVNDVRDTGAEQELHTILAAQGLKVDDIVVTTRAVTDDPVSMAHLRNARPAFGNHPPGQGEVMVAAAHRAGSDWLVTRVFLRPGFDALVFPLIWQTVLIYLVLVGALAFILRRITRPLAALTRRLDSFAETRSLDGQLAPEGPADVRSLIDAHNAMESRIAALLDEKDVMLGAIGHDLKTPLAALRVRIESVEDDTERARMAATIEDIVRTLDDILSLARVGRPSDPRERSELSALVASVVEEYEDIGAPVELGDTVRIAAAVRPTWLRRALRNLLSNALRYGRLARVSLVREGEFAVVRIEDEGPGIPTSDIARMMDPFTRGDPSRNSETGGAGLGLALARAIADQHGGAIRLVNRIGTGGTITGLTAELRLPVT